MCSETVSSRDGFLFLISEIYFYIWHRLCGRLYYMKSINNSRLYFPKVVYKSRLRNSRLQRREFSSLISSLRGAFPPFCFALAPSSVADAALFLSVLTHVSAVETVENILIRGIKWSVWMAHCMVFMMSLARRRKSRIFVTTRCRRLRGSPLISRWRRIALLGSRAESTSKGR